MNTEPPVFSSFRHDHDRGAAAPSSCLRRRGVGHADHLPPRSLPLPLPNGRPCPRPRPPREGDNTLWNALVSPFNFYLPPARAQPTPLWGTPPFTAPRWGLVWGRGCGRPPHIVPPTQRLGSPPPRESLAGGGGRSEIGSLRSVVCLRVDPSVSILSNLRICVFISLLVLSKVRSSSHPPCGGRWE